jgi:hypothetical protein
MLPLSPFCWVRPEPPTYYKTPTRTKQRMSTTTTAIAAYDPMLAALGMEQGEPLKPSNINLLQPIETADEEGLIAGRFRDAQSNMQFETMNLAVLKIQPARVCYPPGSDRGSKPLCRSNDGVLPVINEDLIRQDGGRGCAACPMSAWKKIQGRSIKPPCREVINFLFVGIETEFVYRLNVKGTSLAALKDLRQTLVKSVGYAKSKGVLIPYYGIIMQMGATKIKNNLGTFFNPKFTPVGNLLDPNKYPDGIEKLERIGAMAEFFNRSKTAGTEVEDPLDKAMEGEYSAGETQQEYVAA